ncbi:MAG: hypothetical protein IMZ57_07370 [Acidobacteria bacterium]|nr:hypothetical protein [Acidobacteriota bacterium]
MKSHRPGLYSVKLEFPGTPPAAGIPVEDVRKLVNPVVKEVLDITDARIAAAAHALKAADKYPKALGKLIKDVNSWSSLIRTRLERISAAQKAAGDLNKRRPQPMPLSESLSIEETCFWLGPDEKRPSYAAKTAALVSWLEESGCRDLMGSRMAAIVLGQRHQACRLSRELRDYWTCGSLLTEWSPDLIAHIPEPGCAGSFGSRDKDGLRLINSAAGAAALFECLWISEKARPDHVLPHLAVVFQGVERSSHEYHGRLAVMVNLIKDAQRRIPHIRAHGRVRPSFFADLFWLNLAFELAYYHHSTPAPHKNIEEKYRIHWKDVELDRGDIAKLASVFDTASKRLLGADFPIAFAELVIPVPGASTGQCADRLGQLSRSPDPITGREQEAWMATAGGLAARGLALSGSPDIVTGMSSWIEACRRECPPGKDGTAALGQAVRSLECWLGQAGGDAANLSRLGRILQDHSDLLLRRQLRTRTDVTQWAATINTACFDANLWNMRLAEWYWVLGRLGVLSAEEAEAVLKGNVIVDVTRVLSECPARLKEYFGFLRDVDPGRMSPRSKRTLPRFLSDLLPDIFLSERDKILAAMSRWLRSRRRGEKAIVGDLEGLWEPMIRAAGEPRIDGDFLNGNMWLWGKLLLAAEVKRGTFSGIAGCDPSSYSVWDEDWRVETILLANEWVRQGFPDPEKVFDCLLDRCADMDREAALKGAGIPDRYYQSSSTGYIFGVVQISGGSGARLLRLLDQKLPHFDWAYPENPNSGWAFIEEHGDVREFLWACLDRKEWTARVVGFLRRVAMTIRLQGRDRLRALLGNWLNPEIPTGLDLPDFILSELRQKVVEIAAYRRISGGGAVVPASLVEIMGRKDAATSELNKLREMKRTGRLTRSSEKRLEKLAAYDSDPSVIVAWINKDLERAVGGQLREAKLSALESIASSVIQEFWQKLFPGIAVKVDDDDWNNALRLYIETSSNRSLLKKLLRNEARGDRQWILRLAPNRAFRDKMNALGIDMDAWLGEFEMTCSVGGDIWTLRAETDPLRVLQMGNLFDTCLSTGKGCAFATIANAVEVNKRVLFVTNGEEEVIGRKLIGLAVNDKEQGPKAVMVGFRSYGATESAANAKAETFRSPWVKIFFDLACIEMAQRIGARLENDPKCLAELSGKLRLFASWYDDGPEPFDWWIAEPSSSQHVLGLGSREGFMGRVSRKISDRADPEGTLRALLWLGEDALPIMKNAGKGAFKREELSLIRRYTQSGAVRELVVSWLRDEVKESRAK